MSERYIIQNTIIITDAGSLYVAYDNLKSCQVVIKSINIESTGLASKLLEELISLYSLRPYPYFCNITNHFIEGSGNVINSINIVTKYYSKGNLCENLLQRKKSKNYFSEEELLKHVSSLLTGCSIMQKLSIYHRDLKPDNIFIDDEDNLIIGDLGASCLLESSSTIRGSPSYMSPEMRRRFQCHLNNSLLKDFEDFDLCKSDVWSLGVTFLFMITLETQTDFQNLDGLDSRIREKLIKVRLDILRELISQMLVFDQKERKDFVYLKQWFNEKTKNHFYIESSLLKRLDNLNNDEDDLNPFEISSGRPVLGFSFDIPSISIPQIKTNTTKSQRRSILKPPTPSCQNCSVAQEFYSCLSCSFLIHTPCLDSPINKCPKCEFLLNFKDFLITCENCLKTFKGDEIKPCLHKLCATCQINKKNCRFCSGFQIFSIIEGDISLIESYPCVDCEVTMKVIGKVMFCEKDNVKNCIGCKRKPHQDSCIRYDTRTIIPCINCDQSLEKKEPSLFVNCHNCVLIYCYVCSKAINEVSHLNCSRIYSSYN